ncbi:MAG: chemotaxis protein CheX [Fimbriimonadales bacterium]
MEQYQRHLLEAAILTFEDFGFLFASEEVSEAQMAAEPSAAATVHFTGHRDGSIVVELSGDLLPRLSANILGEDEAPSAITQLDALGEVTNVICGNLLPSVEGKDKVFNLGAPQYGASAKDLVANQNPAATATIGLEEGKANLYLFLEQAA